MQTLGVKYRFIAPLYRPFQVRGYDGLRLIFTVDVYIAR